MYENKVVKKLIVNL